MKPEVGNAALVTGGAVRIGRAIVLALARAGWDVVVHYRASGEAARDTCAAVRALGRRAWPVRARLDTPAGCRQLWRRAAEKAGGIGVLVNNASIFSRQPLLRAHADDFERHWRINALAPMMLTQMFALSLPPDDARGCRVVRPQVVNLLDRRIAMPEAGCIPYAMSKQVLHAFTLSAALELAPRIAVNAVAPGAVLPPPGAAKMTEAAGRAPLDAACSPQDVAAAVCFLVAQRCVTGQVLYVDAGQHLWSVESSLRPVDS